MNSDIVQRIALKAVVVDGAGRALILREAATYEDGTNVGRYGLPGGRLELGEAWQDGLRREVAEETGLEVDILHPIYVGEWRPVIRGVQNQIVAVFLVCRVKDASAIQLSSEHDAFEWVTAATWQQHPVMPPDDAVLQAYFAQAA